MTIIDKMAEILTAHQRHVKHETNQMCLCGWGELGRSHPEHQATVLVAELGFTEEQYRSAMCPDHWDYDRVRYITEWMDA